MQPHPSGNPPLVYAWLTMKREMGELELIERIRSEWGAAGRGAGGAAGCDSRSLARCVALGIGDDCAILRPPRGHELLVTTDFTLEGRHFRRDLHPPESAGHRMLARGLSDLAAMGARPLAAFLSLALPGEMLATRAGRVWVGPAFSLIRGLPSSPSASAGASLFGRFCGTTPRSDSSGAYMRAVWLDAFSRRSAAVSGADAPEVSRFPCMKFPSARGLFDCAEPSGDSRFSPPSMLPSLFVISWALRSYSFAAQSPGPPMPLSTLRWLPRGTPRKTRGQDGSLLLSCETLSFSTPCRFFGACEKIPSSARLK